MSCGAETEANSLLTTLTQDLDVTIPNVDFSTSEFTFPGGINNPLYNQIQPIDLNQLTEGIINGNGVFDKLMQVIKLHLQEEYKANRISGAEYTKAYISGVDVALQQSMQFLLTKDNAYLQSVQTQVNALKTRTEIETAKLQATSFKIEAQSQKSNYALNKLKLSSESINYCTVKYTLDNMLPQQLSNLISQKNLINEQIESQRGQTTNTRTNGDVITGILGTQKSLYNQQITSYQRDMEVKVAKIYADAFITQKTIDEGLVPPTAFTNATIDDVFSTLKTNANL